MKNIKSSNIGGWISVRLLNKKHNVFGWIRHLIGINGLVITLLIGILINTTSDYIQKIVNRQKYFELLQWEMTTHLMNADSVFSSINDDGAVYNRKMYQNLIYNSGLNNGYLFDLSPNEIAEITSYYNVIINYANTTDESMFELRDNLFEEWSNCVFSLKDLPENEDECENLKSKYDAAQEQLTKVVFDSASMVLDYSEKILNNFRPTKKRLESPFLRFFMGSESLEILK